ncbi:MAG: glycoside hydrolase family 15 protein [Clostridia bacterium]|nr:glycoside hydrolase family 15 protein [Clostridia bacterium]
MNDGLAEASIALIERNQHSSGAYIASPSFPTYAYCWLRDGSYTAHAMGLYGQNDSAAAFFRWVNRTIAGDRMSCTGRSVSPGERARRALRARWTLEGKRDDSEWPNYQPDGYGAWLWALDEHVARTGDLGLWRESLEAVRYVVDCLSQAWAMPSSDCWEEHPDRVHTSTLACIAGGVERVARRTGDVRTLSLASEIRGYILEHGVFDGRLAKFCGGERRGVDWPPKERVHVGPSIGDSVDASLLWAAEPFRVLDPYDPRMARTVHEIERGLVGEYGVHRYSTDTYYGGGLWLLLTAWLGWHYCGTGAIAKALSCLKWIEEQADEDGCLGEQVSRDLIDPALCDPWIACWGRPADPLLWSHAMYLILRKAIEVQTREV